MPLIPALLFPASVGIGWQGAEVRLLVSFFAANPILSCARRAKKRPQLRALAKENRFYADFLSRDFREASDLAALLPISKRDSTPCSSSGCSTIFQSPPSFQGPRASVSP